jgi:hypothetical protein
MESKEPFAIFTKKGKDMINWTNIIPWGVNTNFIPLPIKNLPIGFKGPMVIRTANPITRGDAVRGRVDIKSSINDILLLLNDNI